MQLKHLELHGYKTFASRTGFSFESGITAIVGPNGCGKSNIADAIRWVLGEQSYRALRGKRTEDMIFSGSAQRARLGMASASLTFDNAHGWLPIDFSEVTLTRRAYRSGENEYLINGRRVRLSDVTELLAKSGLAHRTYAVIGQGVVDAVLSLRAEDRRALFEEAAGISVYRSKRADALNRLEETRANLVRVHDIVHEIAPRLLRLEREAERARVHGLLTRQLDGMLRTLHGFRWHQVQLDLRRARDAAARRETRVNRHREALLSVQERMTSLQARQAEIRDRLGGWHRASASLHRTMEEVQRGLAVWNERVRLLALRGDEHERELADLGLQAKAQAEQVESGHRELSNLLALLGEREQAVRLAQSALREHEGQREVAARALADSQAHVLDLATHAADRRSRLAQLGERRLSLTAQLQEHRSHVATLQASAAGQRSQIESTASKRTALEAERDRHAADLAGLDASLAAAQARQIELRASLNAVEMAAQRLQSRFDMLGRLRTEGEGLYAGVRAVLQASATPGSAGNKRPPRSQDVPSGLEGVVGSVAQLIRVSQEHETAIEVALGAHLQDVVVKTWANAEAAITYLRQGEHGRATFLPMDTVRPVARFQVPSDSGVVGVAADLVQADPSLNRVVEMLLGRTLVVADLGAARRAFDRLQGGFQVVTLAGDVLRSSGSVTGGQGQGHERGRLLAREREWRELPSQLDKARGDRNQVEATLAEVKTAEQRARDRRAEIVLRLKETSRLSAEVEAELLRLERDADRNTQLLSWRQGLLVQLDGQLADLGAREVELASELDLLETQIRQAKAKQAALQLDLDALRGESLYQAVAEARTADAVARRNAEHWSSTLKVQRERLATARSQFEAKRQRLTAHNQEQSALSTQIEREALREADVQRQLAVLASQIEPAEAEISQLETQREELAAEESGLRSRLREAESSYAQAELARGRQEDRRQRLRRQIVDDFGLVDMESMEDEPDQPPLPLAEMVSTLPVVESLPAGLEEDVQQLRAQIRRLGSVHSGALDEYAEARARHDFLTTQTADLEQAAERLRQVIAEMDSVMQREFRKTFDVVSERFHGNFAQLFGGGTARLILTEPDDISSTGVEIVARPPGKRQQTLALLSGGERSLTAVALVFAFLQTNPPPFCILDEVDAMLDEANVQRFRQMLCQLAEKTQFIVITHNRMTVQAADTIYGVSMGNDSASQVISLRLEGDRVVTSVGVQVELKAG